LSVLIRAMPKRIAEDPFKVQNCDMSRLSKKVAIVTGASKGIGGGIATALGAAGARVAVNYSSDQEGAERVAQAITDKGGKATAVGVFYSGLVMTPQAMRAGLPAPPLSAA
jgi:NAD(P)-dependent dehydrogenase (short-subunit alcohol dehydrogenase family)